MPVSLGNTEGCGPADYTGSTTYAQALQPNTVPATTWLAANSITPHAVPAWAAAPPGTMATFLGTQADPAPIIIRQQRTLYTQYAAAPLPPGPWPMPYRGAASTLVPADLSEDVFMPDEPPPGGLGAFVAAGAGLCGVHQPEHESQLLSGSPSPEHAFAHHAAAVGPALVSNPPEIGRAHV